ncbi:MAG: hypothetical protein ABIL09_28590 [Gemmatimonadota bacterium]
MTGLACCSWEGASIDPGKAIDAPVDTGVRGGCSARLEAGILAGEAQRAVDVSSLVAGPGRPDMHIRRYCTGRSRSQRGGCAPPVAGPVS